MTQPSRDLVRVERCFFFFGWLVLVFDNTTISSGSHHNTQRQNNTRQNQTTKQKPKQSDINMQSQLIRRSVSCPILNSISSSRGLLCNNSTSLAAVGTGNDAATGTTSPPNSSSQITVRYKHSSRQIKRLFKNNPARLRVEARMGIVRNDNQKKQAPLLNSEEEGENQSSSSLSSERKYPPILKPHFLPNGWCPLPNSDGDGNAISIPSYPFTVSRTKNKPNDAVGFLPVYSEFRYVNVLFRMG